MSGMISVSVKWPGGLDNCRWKPSLTTWSEYHFGGWKIPYSYGLVILWYKSSLLTGTSEYISWCPRAVSSRKWSSGIKPAHGGDKLWLAIPVNNNTMHGRLLQYSGSRMSDLGSDSVWCCHKGFHTSVAVTMHVNLLWMAVVKTQ